MPSAIFDGLTYFIVDWESMPSGWTKTEKRNARKRINRSVGKQGDPQTHLNTWHRKDLATVIDGQGVITQTANKSLQRADTNMADQEIIDKVNAEAADELGKDINAVKQQQEVTVLGNQQAMLDHIAANKARYGEQI